MTYKELEAYKKGYELVKVVYEITKLLPKEEVYGIVSQMRRSSLSIPCNIGEGYMRGSKEYIQFLKIALGSCAELETQLNLSNDLFSLDKNLYLKAVGLNEEVIKLLRTYINKLSVSTNRFSLTAKR
jgi:four helix bundle protein